jgi:hypothetical protein
VSSENFASPHIGKKDSAPKEIKGNSKGDQKGQPDEAGELSEEETVVKGYAGRVKKIKQMREKMESNLPNGKQGRKNDQKNPPKEVVIETEHGNMMIKGGVDLKKLFLN